MGNAATSARTLAVLCAASACWAFSFGLEAPLASLFLHDRGCSPAQIGWNNGGYYLGVVLAAILAPLLMRRLGRLCPAVGMIASGLTVAAFPFMTGAAGWFACRVLCGAAGALALIPLESLVNHNAPPERRARDCGAYAVSVVLGMALGQLAGWHLYADWPRGSFVLGGLVSVAASLLLWPLPAAPAEAGAAGRLPLARLFDHPLSFGSALTSGFLEAGMMHLVPLYLVAVGFREGPAGWLMGGVLLAVIAFQWPAGWLADRMGRGRILLACYLVVAIGLAALPFTAGGPGTVIALVIVGAASGAFYPLGLALLGQKLHSGQVAPANAWYLGVNCIASLMSQPLSGLAMGRVGPWGLFAVGEAAILLVLAACLLTRHRAKEKPMGLTINAGQTTFEEAA